MFSTTKTIALVVVVLVVTVAVVFYGGGIPIGGSFSEGPAMEPSSSPSDLPCDGLVRAPPMNFPIEVKKLWINIGSFVDPPISDDPETFTIAIEALYRTANKIAFHKRLFVITAAISDQDGFAFMHAYGKWGESSSLNAYNPKQPWSWNWTMAPDDEREFVFVPMLSLRTLILSIPDRIQITLLKTDMQGQDLKSMKHAGDLLKRVHRIESEVYCNGFLTYQGVENDFTDNKKFMKKLGYKLVNKPCENGYKGENDAFWELK